MELKEKIKQLPTKPGVYLFINDKGKIIYIGKAKNLKKRVISHFQKKEKIPWNFISKIKNIEYIETKNEKEALLLELEFIKKYQPKYNIELKDNKNYFFVGITKEDFPRIFITHQPKIIQPTNTKIDFIGQFVKGKELKNFLKELRIILPYRTCKKLPKSPCTFFYLNQCLAICVNKNLKNKYKKIIRTIKILLEIYLEKDKRIEGYDISNISGVFTVGSMVVFENNKKKPSDYRKFKIKKVKGQNDVKSLREVILRRLKHKEWTLPDLILIDGGKSQLKSVRGIDIPVVSLAKIGKSSGKIFTPFSKNFILIDNLPEEIKNLFLQVRDEAHRFAIKYHKIKRVQSLKL